MHRRVNQPYIGQTAHLQMSRFTPGADSIVVIIPKAIKTCAQVASGMVSGIHVWCPRLTITFDKLTRVPGPNHEPMISTKKYIRPNSRHGSVSANTCTNLCPSGSNGSRAQVTSKFRKDDNNNQTVIVIAFQQVASCRAC